MNLGFSTTAVGKCGSKAHFYKKVLNLRDALNCYSFEILLDTCDVNMVPLFGWWWEYSPSLIKELRVFLKKFKYCGVHLPFLSLDLADPNPEIREISKKQMRQAVKLTEKLEADYVVCHPSKCLWNDKIDDIRRWQGAFKEIMEYCKNNSIVFTMEHTITKRGLNIIREFGIKYTLDIGHSRYHLDGSFDTCNYKSIAAFILKNCRLIGNIHVHDNHGGRSGDEHLLPGDGNINFKEIIRALKAKQYNGPLTLEHSAGSCDGRITPARLEKAVRLLE